MSDKRGWQRDPGALHFIIGPKTMWYFMRQSWCINAAARARVRWSIRVYHSWLSGHSIQHFLFQHFQPDSSHLFTPFLTQQTESDLWRAWTALPLSSSWLFFPFYERSWNWISKKGKVAHIFNNTLIKLNLLFNSYVYYCHKLGSKYKYINRWNWKVKKATKSL